MSPVSTAEVRLSALTRSDRVFSATGIYGGIERICY